MKLIDPNGEDFTNFEDEKGNLIKHIDDGSNAVFKLDLGGENSVKNNKSFFRFSGYDKSQKGNNEINLQSVISYSQSYAMEKFTSDGSTTYCNYGAKFIASSFRSAVCEIGFFDMDIKFLTNKASDIYTKIPSVLLLSGHDEAVKMATSLNSFDQPNLVFACTKGHILTFTSDGYYCNIGGKSGNTIQKYPWLKNDKTTKYFYLSPTTTRELLEGVTITPQ